jgi:NAD(P)-dependent dehydrogenase (short-subunit alcohol dehydrogenase family)
MGTVKSSSNHNGRLNGRANGHGRRNGYGRPTDLAGHLSHARALQPRSASELWGQTGGELLEPRALLGGVPNATGKLQGRVAVITGADSAIGRCVATAFAREGADVAMLYDSDSAHAEATRKAVEDAGRRALTLPGDVSDQAFCTSAVQQVVAGLGRLDILVNNATVKVCTEDVQALPREQLERTFQVNVFGYFFMVQACLPFMPRGSAIVATGSETGIFGSDRLPDYSATNGAIHALTRSLAQQLLPRGIRVNAVAAGATPPLDPEPPATPATPGTRTGSGRPAPPEELAAAYVFFASNADSGFITGQVLAELDTLTH